ncbi:hypothetical protein PZB75_30630 (plasmid) [Streptomyces sp. AM 4-1-1]|uniref:hypothetical protein n=1 Tax=Streptomyces sp. AM 4-1-1 TaxID=3028710 RepID=UPI0023B8B0EB|nr:hypothetical protein [Streptomyces sp. AM 4-1-1]WEH37761.1 hypothetical protein PZB75_30630 [Streptomyces sp. AM 4-1-1]
MKPLLALQSSLRNIYNKPSAINDILHGVSLHRTLLDQLRSDMPALFLPASLKALEAGDL